MTRPGHTHILAANPVFAAHLSRRIRDSAVVVNPGRMSSRIQELEVFAVLAEGRSNTEIGAELFLGETTITTLVTRFLVKLGLRDRVQAVVLAYECGLRRAGMQACRHAGRVISRGRVISHDQPSDP